jgi:hypothetical protein
LVQVVREQLELLVVLEEPLIILALLLTVVLVEGFQQLVVQLQLTVVLEVAVQPLQPQEMLLVALALLAITSVVLGQAATIQRHHQLVDLLENREVLVVVAEGK